MAVAVSRDLTVQVLEDTNVAKLVSRQQALRTAIQKGEPKCLGVSLHLLLYQNSVKERMGLMKLLLNLVPLQVNLLCNYFYNNSLYQEKK